MSDERCDECGEHVARCLVDAWGVLLRTCFGCAADFQRRGCDVAEYVAPGGVEGTKP